MLQSESYFSDVKRLDKDGYPKGPTIHKLIGKSATVNAYKHKATKQVHVHCSLFFSANKTIFGCNNNLENKYEVSIVQELPFTANYKRSLSCAID